MADVEKQQKKYEKQAQMLRQNLILRKKQIEDRARLAEEEEKAGASGDEKTAN